MRFGDLDDLNKIFEMWLFAGKDYNEGERNIINAAINEVKTAPTVDAMPVKHGRYIDENCSECGTYVYRGDADNYCPHCGAKMDGERKDKT